MSLGARLNERGEVVERVDPVIVEVSCFHIEVGLRVNLPQLIAVLGDPVELRGGHEAEVLRSGAD